jgi:hypothetical protein
MMLVNVSTCFSALACDRARCPGKYIHLYLNTVDELQANISELHKAIHVTRDDFDIITDYGKHLGPTAEFDKEQFREMMHGELWRYSRRQLDNVLSLAGDDQFASTILLAKIFEAQVCKDLAMVFEQLKSIRQSVDALNITNADANRSTCTTPAAKPTPEPSAFVPLSAETGGACQQLVAVGAGKDSSSMLLEAVRMLANKMDRQHKMLEEHKRLLERQAGEIADMKRLVTSGQALNEIQSQFRELVFNGADALRLNGRAEVVCMDPRIDDAKGASQHQNGGQANGVKSLDSPGSLDARSVERANLLEEVRRVRASSYKGSFPSL